MNFAFKNKSLCFINWMKSGILLVEDLFSEGAFKDISEFPNLRCDYKILKNVLMKIKPNEMYCKKENMFLFKNDKEESVICKSFFKLVKFLMTFL